MRYLDIEDLARFSSDIFHGKVISTNTFWNAEHTRIYTAAQVRINESFKGAARRDQVVTVTQLGGEKDGIRMDYAGRPEFSTNESVVLFATRARNGDLTVVALKQGKLNVEGAEVKRDFSGLTLIDSSDAGGAGGAGKNPRPLALKTARLSLDELRTRIARTK
ncbi:MAG: hypothetical protein ACREEM_12805 [Blastocatellia bacterium]